MSKFDYSKIGTSNMRPETVEDHKKLRKLFSSRWKDILYFNKKSREEIRSFQLSRITELVDHAFNSVPLYREKYSSMGFKPGDIKSWMDFEKLPILTKEELINGFPEKTISSSYTIEFTTRSSGSSGRFVTLAVSPEAIYLDTIQGARQFFMQSGKNYSDNDLALFIYTCPWWVSSIDGTYRTEFLPTNITVEEAVKNINKYKPKILSLYSSFLKMLANKNARLSDAGIELIVIHSEQSTRKERDNLSMLFGIPILDEYSSEELTRIALECPYQKYHIEEDACYIEVVDSQTKTPISKGRGLVIGTNLLNEATPIIRYNQGDLVTLIDDEHCNCKSNFRIIDRPEGRVMDSIFTPTKDIIPSSCFMDLAYNWYLELSIPVHGLRYQIVQEKTSNINLYIVPGSYGVSKEQTVLIKNSLYQLLPKSMSVDVHIVDKVPFNDTVKYRPVLSFVNK